jgi:hypothetical protein
LHEALCPCLGYITNCCVGGNVTGGSGRKRELDLELCFHVLPISRIAIGVVVVVETFCRWPGQEA